MGSLHHLPTAASAHMRLLNQIVRETIAAHPDSRVANAWSEMAEVSLKRFPGPPSPSHPVFDLDTIQDLSADQKQQLAVLAQDWIEHYQNDVLDQLMQIHREMLSLQRKVAELNTKLDDQPAPS